MDSASCRFPPLIRANANFKELCAIVEPQMCLFLLDQGADIDMVDSEYLCLAFTSSIATIF